MSLRTQLGAGASFEFSDPTQKTAFPDSLSEWHLSLES